MDGWMASSCFIKKYSKAQGSRAPTCIHTVNTTPTNCNTSVVEQFRWNSEGLHHWAKEIILSPSVFKGFSVGKGKVCCIILATSNYRHADLLIALQLKQAPKWQASRVFGILQIFCCGADVMFNHFQITKDLKQPNKKYFGYLRCSSCFYLAYHDSPWVSCFIVTPPCCPKLLLPATPSSDFVPQQGH